MKTSFTAEELDQIENNAYEVGVTVGTTTERARIIKLLQVEASEWLSHNGKCDCKVKGEEVFRLIKVIETYNK